MDAESQRQVESAWSDVAKQVEILVETATLVQEQFNQTVTAVNYAIQEQTYQVITQVTQSAGEFASFFTDHPIISKVTGFLRLDWVLGAVDRVDVVNAAAAVRKLQQQYPQETPEQLAHRIIVEKSLYAGGVGLVTSLVPGQALALLAVDLVTTTYIQAEMIYQIAAAYGLDLTQSDRRGEVLTIFGLALGGSRAIDAGLGLLANVPIAGAVIGASANAVMLYSLGYAACRFYEAKLHKSTVQRTELETVKAASENYLEVALAQQVVMDQILVHIILASHLEKSWQEILPQLKSLNLNSKSLAAISENIKSPQPLELLLQQLNSDFAVPLLAQCYRIAKIDGKISPQEQQVIQAIAAKFNLDLNSIASAIRAVDNQ